MKGKKNKLKIKVGDTVMVIAGKDKGKTGTVSQVFPDLEKVVVDGVNTLYRHLRSNRADEKGQRVEYFGPIHVSNVMIIDPDTQKPTRIAVVTVQGEDGTQQKLRKSKKSNATF